MKKTTYIKLPYFIYEGNKLEEGLDFFVQGYKLKQVIYLRDIDKKVAMYADTRCNGLWFLYFRDNKKTQLYKMKLC